MKNTDKITLTVGQLKKLVKEANENELNPTEILREALSYFVQTTIEEYEQCLINQIAADFGEVKEFSPAPFDKLNSKELDLVKSELLKKFGSEENYKKYVKQYILDFYKYNNNELFTEGDNDYLLSNLTFSEYSRILR